MTDQHTPAPEPCFECGSTERIGTACKPCNPELDPSAIAGAIERLKWTGPDMTRVNVSLDALRLVLADHARLKAGLVCLGSMEAFVSSRSIDKDRDAELLARIDFARALLGTEGRGNE